MGHLRDLRRVVQVRLRAQVQPALWSLAAVGKAWTAPRRVPDPARQRPSSARAQGTPAVGALGLPRHGEAMPDSRPPQASPPRTRSSQVGAVTLVHQRLGCCLMSSTQCRSPCHALPGIYGLADTSEVCRILSDSTRWYCCCNCKRERPKNSCSFQPALAYQNLVRIFSQATRITVSSSLKCRPCVDLCNTLPACWAGNGMDPHNA